MQRVTEHSPRWNLYQHILTELALNGAIDISDFPEFVTLTQYGTSPAKKVNQLAGVLSDIAAPASHRFRVDYALTVPVEGRRNVFTGAVVRVGGGQYVWAKDMEIRGPAHDRLVTDDVVVRQFNKRQWRFLHPSTPDTDEGVRVEPEPSPEPAPAPAPMQYEQITRHEPLMANTVAWNPPLTPSRPTPTIPEPTLTLEVLSRDDLRLVLRQSDGKIVLATITETIG